MATPGSARCSRSPCARSTFDRSIAESARARPAPLLSELKMWVAVFWLNRLITFSSKPHLLRRRSCCSSCETSRSVGDRNGVRPMSPRPFTSTGMRVGRVHDRAHRRAAAGVDEAADLRAERQPVRAVELRDDRAIGGQAADARRGCRANPTRARRGPTRGLPRCPGARCCRPAAARSPTTTPVVGVGISSEFASPA